MAEYPERKYKNFTFYGHNWTIEKMEEAIRQDRLFKQAMREEEILLEEQLQM